MKKATHTIAYNDIPWTFSGHLFDCAVNSHFVAKYTCGMRVQVRVEKATSNRSLYTMTFDSPDKYIEWLERIVDEDDMNSNGAKAVNDILRRLTPQIAA